MQHVRGMCVQEVIGSAIAVSLLSGGTIPLWVAVLLSAVTSFAILLVERAGVRHLEVRERRAHTAQLLSQRAAVGLGVWWHDVAALRARTRS